MITELTSALLKDSVAFLKKEPGFLALSDDQRRQKSVPFAALFAGMSESDFVADFALTVKAIKGNAAYSDSKILQALGRYFLKDFPAIFDKLDRDFYMLSTEAQNHKLSGLIPDEGNFFSALRYTLSVMSYQDISEEVVTFLAEVFSSPRMLVQSPVECSHQLKSSIREHFASQYPESFLVFQINPQLIGGFRFFVDGQVQDQSWFSKIQAIHRLGDLVS